LVVKASPFHIHKNLPHAKTESFEIGIAALMSVAVTVVVMMRRHLVEAIQQQISENKGATL